MLYKIGDKDYSVKTETECLRLAHCLQMKNTCLHQYYPLSCRSDYEQRPLTAGSVVYCSELLVLWLGGGDHLARNLPRQLPRQPGAVLQCASAQPAVRGRVLALGTSGKHR